MDALYDYIDKLQNNKADKVDINSSMDVKADKQALDNKVCIIFRNFRGFFFFLSDYNNLAVISV